MIKCEIVLKYPDERTADTVARSISPDNEGYVSVKLKGTEIFCEAEATSPMKLLHTLDDLLACISVAEDTTKKND